MQNDRPYPDVDARDKRPATPTRTPNAPGGEQMEDVKNADRKPGLGNEDDMPDSDALGG